MFGYVRPLKTNLSDESAARFRVVYCGLCHALKKRYGSFMSLFLNYDFTFLALVLDSFKETGRVCNKRCISKPFYGCHYREPDSSLFLSADISVILTYYKLKDTVRDESFFKSLLARLLILIMKRNYEKAKKHLPEFDQTVRIELQKLDKIEKQNKESIDLAADTFALLLSSTAKEADLTKKNERILSEMFYHIGRFIYIVDAINDLQDDLKKKRYNPIAARFSLTTANLSEDERNTLYFTIDHSLSSASSAFELLDISRDRDIIINILYFGLRAVTAQVMNGTWGKRKRK
ncbi:MAG: DUF5685 family protein [Clostridiales bacterium]|nr:DUF5685 family protein [Clostridiales bacterium]